MKSKYNLIQITKKMEEIFTARMQLHRSLIKKNLLMMQGYLDLSFDVLNKAANAHDLSKYHTPERDAYIWMTWMYHCKNNGVDFKYPEEVENIVQAGWKYHIVNNSHHPEAHKHTDAMTNLDIVEMVCDWTAISQEQNLEKDGCMSWAITNIDKKWHFSSTKKKLIFATIQELNKRN